ncbi:MAG: hypothetical protein QG671_3106 [Actinomycetota bacterium]|nr:hypothetical protein [Actinomycetota bacterium]
MAQMEQASPRECWSQPRLVVLNHGQDAGNGLPEEVADAFFPSNLVGPS